MWIICYAPLILVSILCLDLNIQLRARRSRNVVPLNQNHCNSLINEGYAQQATPAADSQETCALGICSANEVDIGLTFLRT